MNQLNNMYKQLKFINFIIILGAIILTVVEVESVFLNFGFTTIIFIDLILVFLSSSFISKLFDTEEFIQVLLDKYIKLTIIFGSITYIQTLLNPDVLYIVSKNSLGAYIVTIVYAIVMLYSILKLSPPLKYAILSFGTFSLYIICIQASMEFYSIGIVAILGYILYLKYKNKLIILKIQWMLTLIATLAIDVSKLDFNFLILFLLIAVIKSDEFGIRKQLIVVIYYITMILIANIVSSNEALNNMNVQIHFIINTVVIFGVVLYKKSILNKTMEVYDAWF